MPRNGNLGEEILMLRASIIINTLNRREFLERTLESLHYLRYSNFEVICVNGPSTDGTNELLERWRGKIKIASCPEANLSRSRNIGIKQAAGEIVCFIDDDAIPEPPWLSAIIESYSDPTVVASGGYIRDNTGTSYQAKHIVCNRYADSIEYDKIGSPSISSEIYTALTGTNCSFRRDALIKIGGFDEAYAYFLDETDVLIRLHDKGYKIICIEGAEIHHKYAPSSLRDERKIARTLYFPIRSKTYFAYRHALERYGFSEVLRHIDNYITQIVASQKWLFHTGAITEEHLKKLLADIRKGYIEGLKLAFHAEAPFVKNPSFFKGPPAFLPFPIKKEENERLKICFISQDYLPKPNGGIGVWMGELSRSLAARGNEVTVITHTKDAPTIDFEENVWVHRIQTMHFPERPYSAPKNLPQIIYDWSSTAYTELLRVSLMRGVDIASAPIWDVEGIVSHCSGKIPVCLSLHTSYGLALPSKPLWRKTQSYFENHVQPVIEAEKLLLKNSPFVFANSRAIVRDLESCYSLSINNSRLAIVPHGLRDAYTSKNISPSHATNAQTILFVGRFEERKGIDVLLEVIPMLAEQFPTIQFVLAGKNTISEYWSEFTKKYNSKSWFKNISAPGFVDDKQLRRMYQNCTFFVAPSRYESFGLIYLEAMMCGKPCIGTNAGGIPEVVRNNITGITVSAGSVNELYDAIITLLEKKSLCIKLGEKSREIFLQEYTNTQMAMRFEAAIHEFINKRSILHRCN